LKIVNNIKTLVEKEVKYEKQTFKRRKRHVQKQALNYADYVNPVSMEKAIFTREQIGSMLKEEFNKHEKAIMAQMRFIGVPTEHELPLCIDQNR
jgi:hypothetical protein